MESAAGITRTALQRHLQLRAAEDEAFRRELLREPRAVIERELQLLLGTDATLRPDTVIRVHEETDNTFHLVLPPAGGPGGRDRDSLTILWRDILTPRE